MVSPSIMRHREFRKLWAGQGVSLFGSLISRLVLPFFVIYTLSATPLQVAWIRIAEVLPGIALGLLAGVVADRWRRRHILIVTDGLRAVLIGFIPLLFVLHQLTLGLVIGIAALLSLAEVLFESAYDAYLPTLITPEQLVEANAKLSALSSVAEVTGFGIAGALFEWLGGPLSFVVDMLSFIASAVSLFAIHHNEPPPTSPGSKGDPDRSVKILHGVYILWKEPLLRRLVLMDTLNNLFFGLSSAVYMLYVSRGLHVEPIWQGVLYAAGGVGGLLTASVTTRIVERLGYARALLGGAGIAVVGTALLPLAFGPLWLILLFILGQQVVGDAGDTLVLVGLATLRQQHVANHVLGRIRGAWLVVTGLGTLVGILLGGELATLIDLRNTLFVGVGIRVAMVLVTFFSMKVITRKITDSTLSSSLSHPD